MLKYIFIILFLNAFTFFFWRKNRSGIVNQGIYRTEVNDATTYLIAGMLPQSDEPFSWLLDENCPIKGGVHVISYQNFGFDPRAAAAQIGRDIFERGRTAILITMSLGAEITMYLGEPAKHVAIDPCFGRQSLSRFNNLPAHIVTILLEIGVFVLGWLAYLPIIKSGSKRYTLAL